MFSLVCMLALMGVTEARPATADAVVAGHWEGIVQVRPADYEIDFSVDVQRLADGMLGGSVSFLTQDDPPQPLDSVKVTGNEVVFTTHDKAGVVSSFQGRLAADGMLTGELVEQDTRYPFSARRQERPSVAPAGNLRDLPSTGTDLVDLFNEDRGSVRLMAILSPTCPMCRNGARIMQHYVLDRIPDPNLRVYVVWEKIRPDDSRQHALKAATFAADPRVTHFWSEARVTGEAFRERVGFKKSPAWDVFLLFPTGSVWEKGVVPTPSDMMCNLMGSPEDFGNLPRLNGVRIEEQVKALLSGNQTKGGHSPAGAAVDKRQHPN